ncbi:MAG TPA: YigZ family protein [Fastidiosipila sp.]|nr:YigZ family protein [Fastidiosipila sp.]
MEQFKTLKQCGETTYIDRKSRFIAYARPFETVDEAEDYLSFLRREYSDASHVVFAYRFSLPEMYSRFSDDGEPKGTAGPPLLDILTGDDLFQCGVFVVRYFGGTLLGTGGLVRAYGRAASDAVANAGVVTRTKVDIYKVTSGYDRNERIQDGLTRAGFIPDKIEYLADVSFEVGVPPVLTEDFHTLLNDLAAGQANVERIGDAYRTFGKEDTIE